MNMEDYPMRKFEVGDRVEFTAGRPLHPHGYPGPSLYPGDIGEIIGIPSKGCSYFTVQFNHLKPPRHRWSVYEGDLRKVSG